MIMYVVYRPNTHDNPGLWTVRAWYVLPGQPEPVASPDCSTAATLEAVRTKIPGEYVRMPAMEGDDPAIEEVWI